MTALVYALAGGAALLAALLPRVLSRLPVSPPMVFLALGFVGYSIAADAAVGDPLAGDHTERLTELTVIVALMGAGLALDRPLSWRGWETTWRLLVITMPLSILAVGIIGWWTLGLAPVTAMLLAAALAPTDPVLASEVQVGEPTDAEDEEDEARFALTSEAGLNDGLAFPFTYAAIAMATAGVAPVHWLGEWLLYDFTYRIAAGVGAGLAIGWLLAKLFFSSPLPELRLAEAAEGFVALGCTFIAYGVTELIDGYGFIAVFVCGLTVRAAERAHGYHRVLHSYIEQIERLLTVLVLVLLGAAVARGLFDEIGWPELVAALVFLLVVRPATAVVALVGSPPSRRERAVVSFFGIRGVGSIYYASYGLARAEFPASERLLALVGLVVVLSVVIHGVTATPVMRGLGLRRLVESVWSRDQRSARPPRTG